MTERGTALRRRYLAATWLLAGAVMAAGAGCAENPGTVRALPNRQVVELSADDIVRIMQRCGFTDQLIVELGTDVRNDLAMTGAAEVRVGKKVEAIFAMDGQCLHGTSRTRGSFIYDPRTGAFR